MVEKEEEEEKEEKWREDEYRTCDRCGRSISARKIVGKCIDPDCKKVICEICLRGYCGICDGVLCKDHAYPDEETDKIYCYDHIPKKRGCFIATAAYGTPFEPKIDVLRDVRDDVLKEHILGRGFIKLYYAISPPIANIISKHEWMRSIVREMILEPLVRILSKDRYK